MVHYEKNRRVSMDKAESLNMIAAISDAYGAPGFEDEVQRHGMPWQH